MVFRDMSKTKIRNLQMQVERAIDEMVESGAERGLQVAVYRNGEQIVDAVAGVADPATSRLFTSETPSKVGSLVLNPENQTLSPFA